jgi:lipopolysaccharide transport system permease protein
VKAYQHQTEDWDLIIKPKSGWFEINFKEIWQYRYLILLFVRRDFVSVYKQTILGPLWYVLQPFLTTVIFTLIFSKMAKIPTDGLPPMLFYFAGTGRWSYFADCLRKTSNTFVNNANLFGKVYFPRLTIPVSIVVSCLFSFLIQFVFLFVYLVYYYLKGVPVVINSYLLLLPFLMIILASLGLGMGIIVSALTTKYRDLSYLILFGIQLFMYATPVIYSISGLSPKFQKIVLLNPLSSVIECFRFSVLGTGYFNFKWLLYSLVFSAFMLIIGIFMFNRVEKTFMDTI